MSTATTGVDGTAAKDGAATPGAAARQHLSLWTIASYNVPTLGLGYMFLLVNIYMMKFATDVLLVPASAMGLIFMVSRVWDAVTDPMAGYLSDRTNSRMGRRRPWFLAAILPIGGAFVMLWSPPASLSGTSLILWMAAAVFAFYTAMTIVIVPHTSLGAELTDDTHERTRLFGARHVGWVLGSMAAAGGMQALINADDPRSQATVLSLAAAAATGGLLLWAFTGLKERQEYQGRGEKNPYKAFADVWRNPHARLLLIVFLIESLGGATIGILTPYVSHYIVKTPDMTFVYILLYMVASLVSVPLWVLLARRFGKKPLWMFSMGVTAVGFGAMMLVGEGDVALISALAVAVGLGNGCGSVVSPSVQADVIDYDEHQTGQRKEGAYFAAWNFVFKSATGVTIGLTGVILDVAGFQPNVEQSEGAKLALRSLYALFPFACYGIGMVIFSRFSLGEAEHRVIRAELDARRDSGKG